MFSRSEFFCFTTTFTPQTYVKYTSGGVDYDVNFIPATESAQGDVYAIVTAQLAKNLGSLVEAVNLVRGVIFKFAQIDQRFDDGAVGPDVGTRQVIQAQDLDV